MAILAATDWSANLQFAINVLYVAIGLGFVIFFHELGHFAVAKWCGVLVERFSIGFGPVIWSYKKKETEYALSLIPFGGYVKMLGQDDLDASQLTSEEIAMDPRSYSAKPVGQRMAIISAGVVMNVITGLLFFAAAFQLGVTVAPPVIGSVHAGMPAWRAGLGQGDTITRINGRDVTAFADIMRGVALTTGPVDIEGVRPDGSTFEMRLTPDATGTRRMIGVSPLYGLRLAESQESQEDETIIPVLAGKAAERAEPPFEPGDEIRTVAGIAIKDFSQFQDVMAQKREETVTIEVARKGADALVPIRVPPQPFRTLGLITDIEPIAAIRHGSPAAQAGLEVGDKILRVNDQDVGQSLNPLELPDYFAGLHGENVKVDIKREAEGGTTRELSVYVVPENRIGWRERLMSPGLPVSVSAIGIAYHVIPTVLRVEPGSPAEGKIQQGDRVKKLEFFLPEGAPSDGIRDTNGSIEIDVGGARKNWAFAFWMMQTAATRSVRVTVTREGQTHEVELVPQPMTSRKWFSSNRGLNLEGQAMVQKAKHFGQAMLMGMSHTRNSMLDIYLTLRNLIARELSYKELHGPIGIAQVAYEVTKQGLSKLLLFLGFLSINLAVLNFLPIPVLDGGHMVFLAWEGISRRRPSERVMIAATYCGLAFVLGLMLLVIYLDIFVHRLSMD